MAVKNDWVLRVFAEVTRLQNNLMEQIAAATNDISSMNSLLRLKRIKAVELKIVTFREELIGLEMMFEEPRKYLQSYKEIEKANNAEERTRAEYAVLQILMKGQLADKRLRIFTLFEHLEKIVSFKRAEVQYNRTLLLSLAALLVAVSSILINYFAR